MRNSGSYLRFEALFSSIVGAIPTFSKGLLRGDRPVEPSANGFQSSIKALGFADASTQTQGCNPQSSNQTQHSQNTPQTNQKGSSKTTPLSSKIQLCCWLDQAIEPRQV
ncbi:hypothetical protein AMR42_02140 [Limnothrix sp. PR1529]|nr:hypothetical protein BCR12_01015 [Limnothrix sp. P13C2]PIB15305.1 hypothetical protein AMR42_02140 [Limnothrix sp. PR1529]